MGIFLDVNKKKKINSMWDKEWMGKFFEWMGKKFILSNMQSKYQIIWDLKHIR